jgi:outer membrane protein assembly factor BamE (lipoprotein component of BamABCDE complex)
MNASLSRIILLATVISIPMLPACSWNRTVANPEYRNINPSFIKVGQTTQREVIRKLGPPGLSDEMNNLGDYFSARHVKYVTLESRCTKFEIPFFIFVPFVWCDKQNVSELLVEFDEQGVATGVYRTTRHTIRTPLDDEDDREPQTFEDLTRRRSG